MFRTLPEVTSDKKDDPHWTSSKNSAELKKLP